MCVSRRKEGGDDGSCVSGSPLMCMTVKHPFQPVLELLPAGLRGEKEEKVKKGYFSRAFATTAPLLLPDGPSTARHLPRQLRRRTSDEHQARGDNLPFGPVPH